MEKNNQPRIAIDAMGGDFGPRVMVPGALQAARREGIALRFVGDEELLKAEIAQHQHDDLDVDIVHADDVAGMSDKPSHILRRKKDTSIQVAFRLAKEKEVDGVVSAGHTGVTLACGMYALGRIKGIERPGLATIMPRENKPLVIIDVGANVDSKPRHLVQFAIMAEALVANVLKKQESQIGILSIGEEQGKGNVQVNEAYGLLARTSLNFVGNVEGRDLFNGDVDIVVCDGFVGNVVLKLSEGLGSAFSNMLRTELGRGFWAKLGSILALPALKRFRRRLDYEEYGGAPLLGLNGVSFVCHGSSGTRAIRSTVEMAGTYIRNRANDDIRSGLEAHPEISRFHRLRHMLHTPSGKGSNQHDEPEDQT
ncbi:MAG: phosphate acyltransferase PlsX [Desulfovermiculus sp.]|nr:phosphate acyltransferase PlsX [Desulfovermiculus sp.]